MKRKKQKEKPKELKRERERERERNLTLSKSVKGGNRERGYHFMVFSTLCRAASTGLCSDNTTTTKEIDGPLRPSLATPRRHSEGSSLGCGCCVSWFSFSEKNFNLPRRPSLQFSSGAFHFSKFFSFRFTCEMKEKVNKIIKKDLWDQRRFYRFYKTALITLTSKAVL